MELQPLDGFRMHNLREDRQPSLVDKVVELWLAQKVLNEAQAEKRAEEVLLVAVDEQNGNVAGICTTYLRTPPSLRMPLWHFRTFVGPEYRQNDVAYHLLQLAIDYHESQFVDGTNTSGLGLYMEIENPIIQRHRNEAVWPTSGLVFVGFNARGDHCRVRYFPGVRIS